MYTYVPQDEQFGALTVLVLVHAYHRLQTNLNELNSLALWPFGACISVTFTNKFQIWQVSFGTMCSRPIRWDTLSILSPALSKFFRTFTGYFRVQLTWTAYSTAEASVSDACGKKTILCREWWNERSHLEEIKRHSNRLVWFCQLFLCPFVLNGACVVISWLVGKSRWLTSVDSRLEWTAVCKSFFPCRVNRQGIAPAGTVPINVH
jgi:hypothetical protein